MNEQLIKFIELCLMDGVVTDKEREVIFRKSKELGVPEDECEIILEGMIQQKGGVSETKNEKQKDSTPKKVKINFQKFIDKYKNDKNVFGKKYIIPKTEIKKHYSGWLTPSELKKRIDEKYDEIVFGFNNSIIVLEDGSIISYSTGNSVGEIYSYEQVLKFSLKEDGFVSRGTILHNNSKEVGNVIGSDPDKGYELFKEFKTFLNQQLKEVKKIDPKIKSKPKPTISKVSKNKTKEKTIKVNKEKTVTSVNLLKGNSIKYFKENDVLFSIDFYDEFIIKNKKTKLVYESWLVKKDEIKIYRLDNKSLGLYQFFIEPSKFLIKKTVNTTVFGRKPWGSDEYIYQEENRGETDTVETFSDKFFSDIKFRSLDVFRYEQYIPTLVKWNKTIMIKFGKKLLQKFSNHKFSFSLLKTIKIKELEKEWKGFYVGYSHDRVEYKSRNQIFDDINLLKEYVKPPTKYFSIEFYNFIDDKKISSDDINENEREYFIDSFTKLELLIKKNYDYLVSYEKNELSILQKEQLSKFNKGKDSLILDYDIFFQIVKTNQKDLIKIDEGYVQKFIKLNNYLKEKKSTLNIILNKLSENIELRGKSSFFKNEDEISFFIDLVKSYNLMVNHSIVMVTSIIEGDMITFYEIYEVFDKLNVFNTNWENEVNDKLSDINESLNNLNFSINGLINQMRGMERNIINRLEMINISVGSLENSVNKQLSETNSRLKYENLTNYYKKSTLIGEMDWFDGPK